MPRPTPNPDGSVETRARISAEMAIVFGLTLGQSAVFSMWRLVERYLREAPVASQTATLNTSASSVSVMDAIYQVLAIGFRLVPVLLALYLLSAGGRSLRTRLGFLGPRRAWWVDLGHAAGLAAFIGLPGIAVYVGGRALGATVRIDTSGLPDEAWSAAILLVGAASIAVYEETLVVGYLVSRARDLAWSTPVIVLSSAVLRGAYHLYQGWPMALGNALMGAIFAWYFARRGRLGPLIAAHAILDGVAFVGPELLPESWLDALSLT